jgi:hypothetical protein
MKTTNLLSCLALTLLPIAACAQGIQNFETYYLAGPSFTHTQTIGGSNVTVYGSTGYSGTIGVADQIMRKSTLSLWIEFVPVISASPAAQTATIPGSVSLNSAIYAPAARLMVPIHSRISVFGALGGGYGSFSEPSLTSDTPPDLKTSSTGHRVLSLGGGIDFRLSRHFGLRVDVRDYVTGRDLGGVPGRNHLFPMLGPVFHW